MRKIFLLSLVLIVAAFGAYSLLTQKTEEKVYHVGILFGLDQLYDLIDGFKEAMTELGYIEGKNIIYDTYKTNVDPAADQQIINKFVADKVNLIFIAPTETVLLAREITQETNIPLVFANVVVEGNDLVENIQQPGGRITGVRLPGPEYTAKRLEILHEIAPQVTRVWITYDPNNPNNPPTLEALHRSASPLGITIVEVPVTSVAEIQADLESRDKLDDIGIDAIMTVPEWLSLSPESLEAINNFSLKHKIPIVSTPPLIPSATAPPCPRYAIFSYISKATETGRLAADIVDKILQGTPVGTVPVTTPEAHLQINHKAIQELGLNISDGLLSQADEIIR